MTALSFTSWFESLPRLFGLGIEDEDEPRFDVLALPADVELRRYAPALFVEVTLPGDEDASVAVGRDLLVRYVLGENAPRAEWPDSIREHGAAHMPMSTPLVSVRGADGWRVRLFLGNEMAAIEAPAPMDPRVRLVESPERVVAVTSLRGHDGSPRRKAEKRLLAWLASQSTWSRAGEIELADYDARAKLPFFDRHELQIEITESR
ncbi:MAG: heme-binding protein [Deltaproteobacteria bacterium]|nr:heme-binding protein [Deltaproteobacteria bacterium]